MVSDARKITVGTFQVTPLMREYVNGVLDRGRISYGELSRDFEQQFAALHDARFAVLSNSGTSSLQVAVQALKELRGWQDGDEIIVPAVTFVASVNVILHSGLKPVLVDVDPVYYEINDKLILDALTPRTRAILPVHLFGQPCDMTRIKTIADKYGLAIIEDSCECMFAAHNGKSAGAWGDVGCFSTYVAHLITTGVGGIGVTNDVNLAVKMRSLVNHGRDGIYMSIDDDDALDAAKRREVIAKRFRFESIGHSYRITELEAALGLAQLQTWKEMIAKRRANAAYLADALEPFTDHLQLPSVRPLTQHSWMMYPLVVLDEPACYLTEYLEAHGIETRQALPLTNQPCYRFREADYPVAQWMNDHAFYVGCHQGLNAVDLDYIAQTIGAYFGR